MNNQSSSEFLSPPQNNFEQIVKSVGITLNTPPRYLYDNFSFKEETTKDELTGLPIESDVVRKKIAGRLGQATRDNQGWVCIYADADNLKTANTKFGRDFGDLVIKYGAAVILETIDRIGLNKNTEIYALRQTQAADETVVWIFGLTTEELEKLKKELEDIQPVKLTEPKYEFSVTSAILDNDNEAIKENLEKTRKWLKGEERRIPLDFYQEIKDKSDAIVKQIKISKGLLKLPINELINDQGLNQLIKLMVNDFGDTRINGAVLEIICKLVSLQTLQALRTSDKCKDAFNEFLFDIGVSEQKILSVKTPEDIHNLFKDLFGSLPNETAFDSK